MRGGRDLWLTVLQLLAFACYLWLFRIKGSGDGWGYGWNLVAFLVYSVPAMLIVGGLYLWRRKKIGAAATKLDAVILFASFLYPFISIPVLMLRLSG
jgi:hypothetical protein